MTQKKRGSWRQLDPFVAREQNKYGQAAPSREFILHYLEERGMPLTLEELRAEWRLEGDWEVEALARRLRAMERDGQLIRELTVAHIRKTMDDLMVQLDADD